MQTGADEDAGGSVPQAPGTRSPASYGGESGDPGRRRVGLAPSNFPCGAYRDVSMAPRGPLCWTWSAPAHPGSDGAPTRGGHTLAKPNPEKSSMFAVAKWVTPCCKRLSATRQSKARRRAKASLRRRSQKAS